MQRFSFYLTPSRSDFMYTKSLIEELCSKYDSPPFEPHLTLYSGDLHDPDSLKQLLLRVARGVKPLSLRVRGIGCSDEYFKTLFVRFDEHPVVQELYREIRDGVDDHSGYQLIPHMSLLYKDLPLSDKEALAKRVVFERKEVCFDAIKLVTPENRLQGWRDTAKWKTLLQVNLAQQQIKAVLFDFGGVVAEEGFREGLYAIARKNGVDPQQMHQVGLNTVYESGYVLGTGSESDFWNMMRKRTRIAGDDSDLSDEIMKRFVVRPRVLEEVRKLRKNGIRTAILSDQTDWLARLDARDHFFKDFDYVFNSYELGKGKRDPSMFHDSVASLGISPQQALFIDDMQSNVERATACGLNAILCSSEQQLIQELEKISG